MKKPTPAQLAARARFAEMARSGAFKRKAKRNPAKKTVSQKINQLVHEGYPQKQAVAVALSEQRAGKVKRNPVGNVANLKKRYNALLTTIAGLRDDQKRRAAGLPDELEGYTDAEIKKLISMYQAKASDLREAINMYQRNPATGHKGSRTKLNPMKSTFKYALVEDDGGFSFGMDDRTPVSFVFSPRDRTRGVYRSFQLPDAAVKNPAFQQYASSLPGNMAIMSLQELRRVIKGFMG